MRESPVAGRAAARTRLTFPAPGAKLILLLWGGLFFAALACWPVDVINVAVEARARAASASDGQSPAGGAAFRAVIPLGQSFWTGYVHSVQRTPVLDCYRVAGGRIWAWRELVQSHNAGLPFQAPDPGGFYMDPPWMIIEGGRRSWPEIHLRVGNAEFGRNVLAMRRGGRVRSIALYEEYPGRRLTISASRCVLAAAPH